MVSGGLETSLNINITEMLSDENDVKVTFNHQPSFCWPHRENIWVPTQNVLSVVDICTITARNYTVNSDTAGQITEKLYKM